MKKKYMAREGSPFKGEKAQIYGECLADLTAKSNGKLIPQTILSEAQNRSSPLHDYFDWSDTVAAKKWRIHQARDLINHIVEVVVVEGKQTKQRSFFSVHTKSEGQVYVTLKQAIGIKDYRVQLLEKLISTLENATQLMVVFKNYD